VGLDTSDRALAALLTRLRVATDLAEILLLSKKIERVIFHKQFEGAWNPCGSELTRGFPLFRVAAVNWQP
jgi:hypothetical protein